MQLRLYSDRAAQMLHLSPHLWGDTLIMPCDVETQPLWLQVVVSVYYPDACHKLVVAPDAQRALYIQPEALEGLRISPDAVKHLRDQGYAEVALAIAPDASVIVRLSTENFAEKQLMIGDQARARIRLLPDGSAELSVDQDAAIRVGESLEGEKALEVKPDATVTIKLDLCDEDE
jgi:hypothetical protein